MIRNPEQCFIAAFGTEALITSQNCEVILLDLSGIENDRSARVVAVDIGNVCVHLESHACATRLGFTSVDHIRDTRPEIFKLAGQMEAGEISADIFVGSLIDIIDRDLEPQQVIDAWNTIIGHEIDGMRLIIQELLNMNLRPVFFSNISSLHYQHFRNHTTIAELVPDAILSYEVGGMKPNPLMYETMERDHCNGGMPVLYLDDREENIETALNRGWNAYQVGTIAGIRQQINQVLSGIANLK